MVRKGLSRRRVLASSGITGLAVTCGASSVAPRAGNMGPYSPEDHRLFMHGVASGDPLPTSVVIWTRVTPNRFCYPGSGHGLDVDVSFQVAREPDFSHVVAAGVVTASAARDHTVHVDVVELEPDTEYFYRFRVSSTFSDIGRTRTAPADDAEVDRVRLAACSCANYEAGHFDAYGELARRAAASEIDAVVFLGDYLYEDPSGHNIGKAGIVRRFTPRWKLVKLNDYRARYGCYREDPQLQAAHAACPWIVTWDDHELANDAFSDGAGGHCAEDGEWASRRRAAMRAYMEWMPTRATSPAQGGHMYRALRFGTLVELSMLDLRSYRSDPSKSSGKRMMTGHRQFEWLSQRLRTANTRWFAVGNSVMISPISLVGLPSNVSGIVRALAGSVASVAPPFNPDQWDGFPAERYRLLQQVAEVRPDASTVFLTGDIHSEWATSVEHAGQVIGAEIVCSSINSPNFDDTLQLPLGSKLGKAVAATLGVMNPHVEHVELDDHGFALVTFTRSEVEARWVRVGDVYRKSRGISHGPVGHFHDGRWTWD